MSFNCPLLLSPKQNNIQWHWRAFSFHICLPLFKGRGLNSAFCLRIQSPWIRRKVAQWRGLSFIWTETSNTMQNLMWCCHALLMVQWWVFWARGNDRCGACVRILLCFSFYKTKSTHGKGHLANLCRTCWATSSFKNRSFEHCFEHDFLHVVVPKGDDQRLLNFFYQILFSYITWI